MTTRRIVREASGRTNARLTFPHTCGTLYRQEGKPVKPAFSAKAEILAVEWTRIQRTVRRLSRNDPEWEQIIWAEWVNYGTIGGQIP